jgi:hypothetical protein
MHIEWTRHALERQKLWQLTHGITREDVEAVLMAPEQVVPGHGSTWVAQGRKAGRLLRVAFRREGDSIKVLTVYWTSRVGRYFKEEGV